MGAHEHAEQLIRTAREIVANDSGILAADESTGTIGKRFDSISSSRPRRTGAPTATCCSPRPGWASTSAA